MNATNYSSKVREHFYNLYITDRPKTIGEVNKIINCIQEALAKMENSIYSSLTHTFKSNMFAHKNNLLSKKIATQKDDSIVADYVLHNLKGKVNEFLFYKFSKDPNTAVKLVRLQKLLHKIEVGCFKSTEQKNCK